MADDNSLILVADVLGFANIVKNSTDAALDERIETWVTIVADAKKESEVDHTQLISDTLFASAADSVDGFESLGNFARLLLNEGIRNSLPIRGAICRGRLKWAEALVYGPAVIAAHKLETQQDWIGVACGSNIPYVDKLWGHDNLICYPAPKTSGPVLLSPTIVWEIPDFKTLTKYLMGGNLTKDGDLIDWAVARKLRNTIEFRLYCSLAKSRGLDPSKFHGMLPIEAIDLAVRP